MKRQWFIAGGGIAASLLIALGIVIISKQHSRGPEVVSTTSSQMAGEQGKAIDPTFLKGGSLQQGLGGVQPQEFIILATGEDSPSFQTQEFSVHAGKVVSITLENHSRLRHQHNWALVHPGTREEVQAQAEKTGPNWNWIPNTSHVLAFIPLTQPGESKTVLFRAPEIPGDYPFLCTFPGHGNVMNGTLHVIK